MLRRRSRGQMVRERFDTQSEGEPSEKGCTNHAQTNFRKDAVAENESQRLKLRVTTTDARPHARMQGASTETTSPGCKGRWRKRSVLPFTLEKTANGKGSLEFRVQGLGLGDWGQSVCLSKGSQHHAWFLRACWS